MTSFLKMFASLRMCQTLPLLGVALAGALILGGCGAGPDVSRPDTEQIQSLDEVAVVSIRTKKLYQNGISEKSLENTENVRNAVSTITEVTERQERRADPNFQAASEEVRSYLFGPFRLTTPFSLLKEEPVLQSSAYQTAGKQDDNWRTSLFATPADYRSLDPTRLRTDASLQTLTETLPSAADGLLFAKTTYSLVAKNMKQEEGKTRGSPLQDGTHSHTALSKGDTVHVDMEATVRVRVLDRRGSTTLEIEQAARSDEGFTFVYGEGWNTNQIDGATRRATQTVLEKITSRLQDKLPESALAQTSSELSNSESSDLIYTGAQ